MQPYPQPAYPGYPQGAQPQYPGQPQFPAQPQYAGQPHYAGRPHYPAQPPYPGQPGAPTAPGAPRKGLGTGAIVGIVAGAVGILAVAGVGISLALAAGSGSSAREEAAATVEGYLTALAESDAETALSFLDDSAGHDTTLLTDDMLAASNALAPLGGIEVVVPEEADFSVEISATYTIGEEDVATTFSVSDYDDDGVWSISGGTAEISSSLFDGLALTLNGIEIEDATSAEVFPGTYELATVTPNFVLTGPTTITIPAPFEVPSLSDIRATLTDEGVTTFRALVTADVAACLASTTLSAGCGLTLPATLSDGTVLTEGTITRSLSAEGQATLDGLTPEESFSDPLFVNGPFIGGVETNAQCTKDGQTGTCSVLFGPSLGAPLVDFTTEPPVVRWD